MGVGWDDRLGQEGLEQALADTRQFGVCLGAVRSRTIVPV